MSLVIPLRALPRYNFDIRLEGRVYNMTFDWNTEGKFWFFDIANRSGDIIVAGIKLVLNYELIRKYALEDLPPGAIVPIDTTNKLDRIEFNNLGNEVKLIYITEEEVANVLV